MTCDNLSIWKIETIAFSPSNQSFPKVALLVVFLLPPSFLFPPLTHPRWISQLLTFLSLPPLTPPPPNAQIRVVSHKFICCKLSCYQLLWFWVTAVPWRIPCQSFMTTFKFYSFKGDEKYCHYVPTLLLLLLIAATVP